MLCAPVCGLPVAQTSSTVPRNSYLRVVLLCIFLLCRESQPKSHSPLHREVTRMENELSVMMVDTINAERPSLRKPKSELALVVEKLKPLAIELERPKPGDWLAEHREKGQTFEQYVNSGPTLATPERNKIVILPLGEFNEAQKRVLNCVAEFMSSFYGLTVLVQERISLRSVRNKVERIHPEWGDRQILSKWVLDTVLAERLPADAAAYLCLTTSDLWPGRGWNFVFGEASLKDRVGVWSMYRYGDPSAGEQEFRTCLRRILATAAHETAHMFGMRHCAAYSCGMCGSNSLGESDRRPIHFCPQCTPKIAWATGVDLVERAKKLGAFCSRVGLMEEARYYAKTSELLIQ